MVNACVAESLICMQYSVVRWFEAHIRVAYDYDKIRKELCTPLEYSNMINELYASLP